MRVEIWLMPRAVEPFQALFTREMIEDGLHLIGRHARVSGAVQQQDRAVYRASVIDGIVREAVEPALHAAPEDKQRSTRPGRQLHRRESIAHRRDKTVEGTLHDDRVRLQP